MTDLTITKINNVWIHVNASDQDIIRSISDYFCYKSKNAKYRKNRKWDGYIRLFNKNNGYLPLGLAEHLYTYCKKTGLKADFDKRIFKVNKVDKKSILDWVVNDIKPTDEDGELITPYDYQVDALHDAIRFERRTLLAATSAGKSLIIYLLVRYYELLEDAHEGSTLIVVPNQGLVEQIYSDFEEYSQKNGWKTHLRAQKINANYTKQVSKDVVITTYQSIRDFDREYFEQFNRVIIDEAHLATSESFEKILKNLPHCKYRIGLTGSLDEDSEVNKLVVVGMLGGVSKIVTAKELIDSGRATKVEIHMIQLHYEDEYKKRLASEIQDIIKEYEAKNKEFGSVIYNHELDFTYSNQKRFDKINGFLKGLGGHTIVITNRVEKHLEPLYEWAKENITDREVFIVTGSGKYATSGTDREEIRRAISNSKSSITFATPETMSTGVNIKNLNQIVLAGYMKAYIKLLQTIGRLMRKHKSKKVSKIYDVVDVLTNDNKPNIGLLHAFKRHRTYKEQGHPIKTYKFWLK